MHPSDEKLIFFAHLQLNFISQLIYLFKGKKGFLSFITVA